MRPSSAWRTDTPCWPAMPLRWSSGGLFFHHFDPPTCEKLMQKIRADLIPDGQCVTLDFVPQEDRLSPPPAAAFALMMLATTPAGDAYTFTEYDTMFRNAGFTVSRLHLLTKAPQSVIISKKG